MKAILRLTLHVALLAQKIITLFETELIGGLFWSWEHDAGGNK
jgi:hypothetical protein